MRTRREFLVTAGRLGLGAASIGVLVARSRASAAADASRTIHLEAREVQWELAPGKTIKAMSYNGEVPGPTIRAREGERLRIILKNSLTEPTTIHWHGVDVPNPMDGVPGVTQAAVQPGETFTYEFEARPAGTRWYHTHVDEHRQMDLGLAAPLIIDPRGQAPLSYDRDVTLVLDDWATGTGRPLPDTNAGAAGGRGQAGGMMSGMMRGGRGMGGMMGGGMMRNADNPAYDVMTINGKAYPAIEPLRARKGDRLRLRFVNASAEHTHVIRLAGHRLAVTHTDGNPLEAPVEVDAVPIAPAERYDVVVRANHPGAWFLYCTQPGHIEAGERMLLAYEDHARAAPPDPDRSIADLTLWEYGMGRGRQAPPARVGDAQNVLLALGGGMMGSDIWTINGKRYPDTEPIRCKKGDRVRVTLRNNSMEAHPMHLHGQSFRVLSGNAVRYERPIVKDVVDVEAHMGLAVIEFTAHDQGDWLFHCHKPMHMMGGMVSVVKVG